MLNCMTIRAKDFEILYLVVPPISVFVMHHNGRFMTSEAAAFTLLRFLAKRGLAIVEARCSVVIGLDRFDAPNSLGVILVLS